MKHITLIFQCPKCDQIFHSVLTLQYHFNKEHETFQTSFRMMTLLSDGTMSDIYEKCSIFGKLFKNEIDVTNHKVREHLYGEIFYLYPCEECDFRGRDIKEIKDHVNKHHNCIQQSSDNMELEELGNEKLPTIMKRK